MSLLCVNSRKFEEIRGNSRGTSMEGFQDTNRNEVSLCKLV